MDPDDLVLLTAPDGGDDRLPIGTGLCGHLLAICPACISEWRAAGYTIRFDATAAGRQLWETTFGYPLPDPGPDDDAPREYPTWVPLPGDDAAPYGRGHCDGPHGCRRKNLRLDKNTCLPRHKTPDRSAWCRDSGRWPGEFNPRPAVYDGINMSV